MRKQKKWVIIVLNLLIFSPALSFAGEIINEPDSGAGDHHFSRKYDPIEIWGNHLPAMLGKKLDHFALYSFRDGSVEALPFQFDERTEDLKMELPRGTDDYIVLGNGVLDDQDILFFYAYNAGRRCPLDKIATPRQEVEEICLIDPDSDAKAYLYLVYDPDNIPNRVTTPYGKLSGGGGDEPFSVSGKTYIVRGRVNHVRGKTYQTPVYKDWLMTPAFGGNGKDLIDGLKIRMGGSILFGLIKMKFDEASIIGGIEALKVGPVRGYCHYWIQGLLPLKLKSPKGYLDVYIYDHWVLVPTQIKVFMNPGHVITEFHLAFGYDMNENARGMKFYNSNNRKGFLIDGRMDRNEKKMDNNLDTWRAVIGPQGTIITTSVWDERYKNQADISIKYEDNRSKLMPPEDEPGCMGYHYTESRIRSLKAGTYNMLLVWFYPPNIYDPKEFRYNVIEDFLNVLHHPLFVEVAGERFKNPGGRPPYINPRQASTDSCSG